MKKIGILMVLLCMQVSLGRPAAAGDFDWLSNLNVQAEADSSGYRVRLATRFHIGDAEVKAVIGSVDEPSDAYMIFRLGELSHHSVDDVVRVYSADRRKGWGVIAKRLGIKPGSKEFHALKGGHDLNNGMEMSDEREWTSEKHHGTHAKHGKGNKG